MSEFSKKHPELAEAGDTVLSILSGSFALLAIIFTAIRAFLIKGKTK